jgi:hypothetical protein
MRTVAALILSVALPVSLNAFEAGERTDGEPAVAKFGPADVELHLRDGSTVVGRLLQTDVLTLKTDYGTLTFPLSSIVRVYPAIRASKEALKEASSLINKLDDEDFNVRKQAQSKLEQFGVCVAPLLREARQNATAEARSRIDVLLKKIEAQNPKVPTDDVVKSNEFEAVGKLQFESLTIRHSIGEMKAKIEDIESIHWLSCGASKTVVLDCASALDDWVDSGVDVSPDEKVSVSSSGTITLFNNYQTSPDGNANLNGRGTLIGMVVGKIGPNRKFFPIGSYKSWTPQYRGRLYLKIHCTEDYLNNNNNQNTSNGSFTVRVSSGVLASDGKQTESKR